jgi:hypothetical protein
LGLLGKSVIGQKVKSGILLALMLIQRAISYLIARMYVQLAPPAVRESMQNGEGKHLALTVIKRFFLFLKA